MNVFSAWVRATEGSKRDPLLRTIIKYSYIALLVLLGGFYMFFLGYWTSDALCYSTIAVAAVVEAIVIFIAWRTSSR
jgi:hypothetical protein